MSKKKMVVFQQTFFIASSIFIESEFERRNILANEIECEEL